jgi:hypothetical protein
MVQSIILLRAETGQARLIAAMLNGALGKGAVKVWCIQLVSSRCIRTSSPRCDLRTKKGLGFLIQDIAKLLRCDQGMRFCIPAEKAGY